MAEEDGDQWLAGCWCKYAATVVVVVPLLIPHSQFKIVDQLLTKTWKRIMRNGEFYVIVGKWF